MQGQPKNYLARHIPNMIYDKRFCCIFRTRVCLAKIFAGFAKIFAVRAKFFAHFAKKFAGFAKIFAGHLCDETVYGDPD